MRRTKAANASAKAVHAFLCHQCHLHFRPQFGGTSKALSRQYPGETSLLRGICRLRYQNILLFSTGSISTVVPAGSRGMEASAKLPDRPFCRGWTAYRVVSFF